MKHLLTYRRSIVRGFGCAVIAALAAAMPWSAARAEQAPLPDKPFAEHRIVLQLSDNDPKKQGLVISVAYNLLKFYDPDKVAIEVVTFGPGIDLLRPENTNRKLVEPGRARRALRCLPEYRRYHRARNRQAAGVHFRGDAGSGRRRTNSGADRKRIYIGAAVRSLVMRPIISQ